MEEKTAKKAGRPKKVKTQESEPVSPVAAASTQEPASHGILVVIPYLASGAQGRELEYAVKGWRRHFKEKFHIVVVGDYHPICDTGDDIEFIECPQVPPTDVVNYRPHIDHVHKFRTVREHFPDSEGFIYACDDMYAVNDFDLTDVKLLKIHSMDVNPNPLDANPWQRDNAKTRELELREGLPTRSFVCHLPVWYDWDKLLAIYDKYDCDHNSYIVEDLYHNTYFKDRVPLLLNIEFDNFRCGVWRSNPRISYIRNAFRTKIWITNSPAGWIPELVNMLDEYYGRE